MNPLMPLFVLFLKAPLRGLVEPKSIQASRERSVVSGRNHQGQELKGDQTKCSPPIESPWKFPVEHSRCLPARSLSSL